MTTYWKNQFNDTTAWIEKMGESVDVPEEMVSEEIVELFNV